MKDRFHHVSPSHDWPPLDHTVSSQPPVSYLHRQEMFSRKHLNGDEKIVLFWRLFFMLGHHHVKFFTKTVKELGGNSSICRTIAYLLLERKANHSKLDFYTKVLRSFFHLIFVCFANNDCKYKFYSSDISFKWRDAIKGIFMRDYTLLS
jgi:ABC-type long-subunit fatty acid transport system fused permease/ATPase subunit